jgi:hypothetical protein
VSRESQESDRGEGVGHTQCMEHAMTAMISKQQRGRMAKLIPYLDTRSSAEAGPQSQGDQQECRESRVEVSGGHTGGANRNDFSRYSSQNTIILRLFLSLLVVAVFNIV